jgi:hypothetical protein
MTSCYAPTQRTISSTRVAREAKGFREPAQLRPGVGSEDDLGTSVPCVTDDEANGVRLACSAVRPSRQ